MHKIILVLLCLTNLTVRGQLDSIAAFVQNSYKYDSTVERIIDTVINVKEGKYFVLVRNELNESFAAQSGYFDCYEVTKMPGEFVITNSILNLGNNTGGSGLCEMDYKIYKLDENNYLLIALKHVTQRGQYCSMYVVANSENMVLQTSVLDDFTGFLQRPRFSEVVQVKTQNGRLQSFNLKVKVVSAGFDPSVLTSEYTISNFIPELNSFGRVTLKSRIRKSISLE